MSEEVLRQADEHKAEIDRMLAIPAREIERIEHARKVALRFHITTVLLVIAGIVGVAVIAIDNGRATRAELAPLRAENQRLEAEAEEQDSAAAAREVELQAEIAERDATIADQGVVIDQAVYFIGGLCDQVEAFGGQCIRVELDPGNGPPPPDS